MFSVFFNNLTPELLIMRLIAVTLALTVHEFCHGFAAYKLGDRTAKWQGRLSLNPARHIDPMGMILIILFGFGWAKPVMVNPFNLNNPKRDMAIISIAGPLSNFIFAFVAMLIFYPVAVQTGGAGMWWFVINFLQVLVVINIVLGIFNLIPFPPLDGSKILALFLPNHLYFRFTNFRYGMYIMILLIAFGVTGFIITPALDIIFDLMLSATRSIYSLIL